MCAAIAASTCHSNVTGYSIKRGIDDAYVTGCTSHSETLPFKTNCWQQSGEVTEDVFFSSGAALPLRPFLDLIGGLIQPIPMALGLGPLHLSLCYHSY